MHWILKVAILIVTTILITSSAYSILFIGDENIDNSLNEDKIEDIDYKENSDDYDNDNQDDNDDNYNSNEDIKDFTHYVFVEAGTTVCCTACAKVQVYIDELYEAKKYPFYYVSMPVDNDKAAEYLEDYNIYAYPTIYLDGGYEVLMGATDWKSNFEEKMSKTLSRKVPKVLVNVTAENKQNNDEIQIIVFLENYENSTYSGKLKIYLTEIVSTKWQGDQPYSYSFIKFIYNKEVKVSSKGNTTILQSFDSSEYDPENLMIFAVLFNSEKQISYSFPPNNYVFDAYYADAVDTTEIIKGGNLPPKVGISSPTIGYIHWFGNARRETKYEKTILFGRTKIIAEVSDDSKIEKVEFYINDKLMATKTEKPYEWIWHKFEIGNRLITVKAYDDTGKTSTANMYVWALIKWQNPLFRNI